MALHRISKGLDLPIAGAPRQAVDGVPPCSRVALLADDYVGMRPTMHVKPGDAVRRGQLLFEDKKLPAVRYTSPGAGTVVAVHRGERRALQSVVIELSGGERAGQPAETDFAPFAAYTGKPAATLTREEIRGLLTESGQWTAIRARPYGKVADPATTPRSIFVTAMDTNPLAASAEVVLKSREQDFTTGLACVTRLTEGRTFLCKAPGATIPTADGVQVEEFAGVHPAGTVGLHIHTLDPVCRTKTVWYLNYQDVIAIGKLMSTGRLDVERVISLGGPTVKKPRLLKTRVGASVDELVRGELEECENRVISGSVLSGRKATGEILGYLGRYHLQVSALREGRDREFMSWVRPGLGKFSTIRAYMAAFLGPRQWAFTTNKNGSDRAIVPIGMYERVMPMDIEPTYLLRSLVAGDVERAEQLGALELEEEDLALCTFVCPGKIEYGPVLRDNLTTMEKEG